MSLTVSGFYARTSRRSLASVVRAICAIGVLAVVACGSAPTDKNAPLAGDATSLTIDASGPKLWIKDDGQKVAFENGRSVTVDGTNIEIYVSPYPPGRTANVDFYLTRNGTSVDTANVSLQYDMAVMEHGPFKLLAVPTGRGHYLAPLEFFMSGDFWLNVSVSQGSQESVINMFVRSER